MWDRKPWPVSEPVYHQERSSGEEAHRRPTKCNEESGLGSLYFYGARWYSPAVGRFLIADTIVPEVGNPQAYNRYAYSLNNPVRYTDPTGHYIVEGDEPDPTAPRVRSKRCGLCYTSNELLSPATAQRDYGINAPMRVSREVWSSDVGTQPSDLEVLLALTSRIWAPLVGVFGGEAVVAGGEVVNAAGWQTLRLCLTSSICARLNETN
jgi:RHS repeat-associated protein